MALAELHFIDHAEAVHLIGPPGTGKTHISLAFSLRAARGLHSKNRVRKVQGETERQL